MQNPQPDNRTAQTPTDPSNTMDRPLPGSAGPVPSPNASGVAEPIEQAEQASEPGASQDRAIGADEKK